MTQAVRYIIVLEGRQWTKYVRHSSHRIQLFVTGVSWSKDNTMTRVFYSPDRKKAVSVAKFMAERMVAEFNGPRWRKFASMEPVTMERTTDGTYIAK